MQEDEFVYVLSGEVVLITDAGEELLRPGDCAAFPANDGNGHHLVNRSNADAIYCWRSAPAAVTMSDVYPDIDMLFDRARFHPQGRNALLKACG